MDGLTEGRIVHYVLENGEHRPAIVVRDWVHAAPSDRDGVVNLQVFTDGLNDGFETAFAVHEGLQQTGVVKQSDLIIWRTSVYYSETKEPGTWHWIEKA